MQLFCRNRQDWTLSKLRNARIFAFSKPFQHFLISNVSNLCKHVQQGALKNLPTTYQQLQTTAATASQSTQSGHFSLFSFLEHQKRHQVSEKESDHLLHLRHLETRTPHELKQQSVEEEVEGERGEEGGTFFQKVFLKFSLLNQSVLVGLHSRARILLKYIFTFLIMSDHKWCVGLSQLHMREDFKYSKFQVLIYQLLTKIKTGRTYIRQLIIKVFFDSMVVYYILQPNGYNRCQWQWKLAVFFGLLETKINYFLKTYSL